jgi:ankyrin repeat protein
VARLRIVEAAEGSGRIVGLTGAELLLGRDDACDVVVRDRSLSRRHARLAPAVGGWLLIDQESGNGTFVNGQRVHEAILRHGDEVLFGTVRVLFEDPPPEPATVVLPPGENAPPASARPATGILPPESKPVPLTRPRSVPPPPPVRPPPPLPPLPVPPPLPERAPVQPPGPAAPVERVPRPARGRRALPAIFAAVLFGVALAGIAGFLAWRSRGRPKALPGLGAALTEAPVVEERTPLDAGAAIETGDVGRLEELLAGGADPNATGEDGLILVQRAAWAGRADVARLLVSKGADLFRRDPFGLTPAARALVEGRCEIAMILVPKEPVPAGQDGRTYLHRAAEGGCAEAVKELVARGAVVDATDAAGLTPLHVAALSGRSDVLVALLAKGASVAKTTPAGRTPLHLASLAGYAEAAKALLAKGAEPNAKDSRGSTPLHLAAASGNVETVSALLAAKADPVASGPDGTPLDVALAAGAWDTAELLAPPGP